MVHNKETFEQWSTKKRPNHAHSSKEMEGAQRGVEKSSTVRMQKGSEERRAGKGMKRTSVNANVIPLPSPHAEAKRLPERGRRDETGRKGRDVFNHEEVLPVVHTETESPDFHKRHCQGKTGGVGAFFWPDCELKSTNEVEQCQRRKKSWTRHKEKSNMSKDVEKVRSTRKHETHGTSSRMRSHSSSSPSLEEGERQRQGEVEESIDERCKQRSSSAEEDCEHPSEMHQSSRAANRRSSMKEQDGRKGNGERGRKRHRQNYDSDQSSSGNSWQLRKRSFLLEGRRRGRHGSFKENSVGTDCSAEDNSSGSDRSPLLLSEAGSDLPEDSRQQSRRKDVQGSDNSASELPEEFEDEGAVLIKSETTLRKERRDRQKTRERRVRSREKQGQKAYYLHVNHNGKPYGDGTTTWKADLNKLSRTLDPSVMDVREQPSTDMATLRRRLRQNFEYSCAVDPIFIRQLVGRAITQWRNTLWKKMDAGGSCPKGFDAKIWKKLERTRSCPSHNEKSERMKHANRCRITLGRTGPRGEEGVREILRKQKGASPDYDEVFTEMQRDKGYGGKAAKKKALEKARPKLSIQLDGEGMLEQLPHVGDEEVERSKRSTTSLAINGKSLAVEDEYVKSLEFKIAELQAQILKAVVQNRENCGDQQCVDGRVNASTSEPMFAENEKEPCSGEKGRSAGGIVSRVEELQEPSKGGATVNVGRKKLRSYKD